MTQMQELCGDDFDLIDHSDFLNTIEKVSTFIVSKKMKLDVAMHHEFFN